jgi:amidohydrolase
MTGSRDGLDLLPELQRRVASQAPSLVALSHRIAACPELAFEEERACAWVGDVLDAAGFAVERGSLELPTALRAAHGTGPVSVVLCAEYDALPEIGHACGHNLIAALAVGAAQALAGVADDLGLTVTVVGTPAEERGAGKELLLQRGAFDGAAAVLMAHPGPHDIADPTVLALQGLAVEWIGQEAHAAGFPYAGRNAADALQVAHVAIALLRQQLRPGDVVHGITTYGGAAPNVIPGRARAEWMARSLDADGLARVVDRLHDCFRAGALAADCELDVTSGPAYKQLRHEPYLVDAYLRVARALGREPARGHTLPPRGSTDMGNVSLAVPALHPEFSIGCDTAVPHQPEFAAAAVTPAADEALLFAAAAVAGVAAELALARTAPT